MTKNRILVAVLSCLLALTATLSGQSVTGQISGTVTDASGAVVAGAAIQLTHDLSQQSQRFVTDQNGSFIFTGLVPGNYSLHITQPGFKAYDQRNIPVATQERVDLHDIKMQVGEVTSTIEVQASSV